MAKYRDLKEDDAMAKNFRLCGMHISGEGEKEGVIITGYKTLSTGLGFVFNSPLTKLNIEIGETKYKFQKELIAAIEKVKEEAGAYLSGKHGVKNNQPELPLDGKEE